jgi:hypothetical protein
LNGVELPALEEGHASKTLLVSAHGIPHFACLIFAFQVKADERTKAFLSAFESQRVKSDVRPPLAFLFLPDLTPHISPNSKTTSSSKSHENRLMNWSQKLEKPPTTQIN